MPTPPAPSVNTSGTTLALRVAIRSSSLGSVLVAAGNAGIRVVFMGDDSDRIRRDLQAHFPKAQLLASDASSDALADAVQCAVEAPSKITRLLLDMVGTPFQRAVWLELQAIPAGSTSTYSEIARRIGRPTAARAVAQACAANSLAVLVPCHRVVRSDGSLSGYRWGTDRKRELLARERRTT